jgi:hypothetical protein
VIATLVSIFPATQFGPQHYRNLELAKIQALRFNHGYFESFTHLTDPMKEEFQWWTSNITNQSTNVLVKNPNLFLTSDASAKGWVAYTNEQSMSGLWTDLESRYHPNIKELLAICYG